MRACLALLLAVHLVDPLPAQITAPVPYGPSDVWVVVNKNMTASVALGEFYCQQRKVPNDHLIKLDLPETEEMTRADYESKLLAPLREQLKKLEQTDFILLTTYGVPIRVAAAQIKPEEQAKLDVVKSDLKKIHDDLTETTEALKKYEQAGDTAKAKHSQSTIDMLNQSKARLEQQQLVLAQSESYAAVDSELALMWYPKYSLTRWQLNLRYFTIPEGNRLRSPKIVLTCRIDGPTPNVAKRLIEDALKAEAAGGPQGFAYVDARGMSWNRATDLVAGSFGGFDEALREVAALFKKAGFRTELENTESLFPPGTCPRTALYCGWYSLAAYIPCCELMTGSIAYHVASWEAVSLREPNNKRWVPNLLQDGAAVTIGPVAEPYLIAFPKPAVFFGFLLAGHTVVESYWLSTPFTSWQMMIIGDPLYRPFAKKPRLESKEVKLSPEGSQFPPRGPGK
ncbi:MAG TPA: TIGR03790 family protein [Gemmatales bacterium]|nr:TIGR03790 family protein [Gemmatales bacterium]